MAEIQTADAGQAKKVEKETVTVREWIADQKIFLKPRVCKEAERGELNGKPFWRLYNFGSIPLESEITDKDGVVWVTKSIVDETATMPSRRFRVEKKEPKKPN